MRRGQRLQATLAIPDRPRNGVSSASLQPDQGIRERWEVGAYAEAATSALETYGPEIMSFLVAVTRDEASADDAFSLFCLAFWAALPRFRWQSSLRTWLYALARSALGRLARQRAVKRREVTFSPELEAVMVAVRSSRAFSTDRQDRLARLRESLSPEDHMLVVLRVGRDLPWTDVARIMSGEDEPTPEELERVTAALRKRWQRLKEELRRELDRERG